MAEIVNVKIVTSVTSKRGAFNREREREGGGGWTMWKKQILARAIKIKKENWG